MVYPVLGLFTAFAIGGLLANLPVLRRPPLWVLAALAPAACVLFVVGNLALPFRGVATDALAVLCAGGAAAGPMALFFGVSKRTRPAREAPPPVALRDKVRALAPAIAAGVCLPMVAVVLFTLLDRLNYSTRLAWACDGAILEVTRARSNHDLPTLVVAAPDGSRRFEFVEESLWARAQPGQRLVKREGTPGAELDGEPVRMVPRSLPWWSQE